MAVERAQNQLQEKRRGQEESEASVDERAGLIGNGNRLAPGARGGRGDQQERGEDELGEDAVNDGPHDARSQHRTILRKGEVAGDARAAEVTLEADRQQRHNRQRPEPALAFAAPDDHHEHQRRRAHQHPVEAMGMLVEDAALHLAHRIEQHVVAEGIGPVRDGESGLHARHETAGDEEEKDRHRRDDREERGRRRKRRSLRSGTITGWESTPSMRWVVLCQSRTWSCHRSNCAWTSSR